ncbi:MAG: zinc-dependent alcohol dehydrogenase family protein [Chloroflexota bacterium]
MQAMRLFQHAPAETHPLQWVEMVVPAPESGQVLIRVAVCGVCHTDLHTVEGDIHPPRLPLTPGHQVVGTIAQIGEGVENLTVGTRVGVPWLYSACGKCAYCQRGEENLCESARFSGFHVDGGYAEYMCAEANYVLPLPPQMSDIQAAPLLCAGIVGYRSLRKADIQPGERLGLFGFGASAHLAIQVALYWGCEVYVFTRAPEHCRHALELGAVWAGNAQDTPPQKLDRAILFAPSGALVPLMLEKLRPGGTAAINAIHTSPIPEMPYSLLYGERTLRSVANAVYQDGVEFLHLAAQIPIQPTTTIYDLRSANEALLDMKHSRINGEAVLTVGWKGMSI